VLRFHKISADRLSPKTLLVSTKYYIVPFISLIIPVTCAAENGNVGEDMSDLVYNLQRSVIRFDYILECFGQRTVNQCAKSGV